VVIQFSLKASAETGMTFSPAALSAACSCVLNSGKGWIAQGQDHSVPPEARSGVSVTGVDLKFGIKLDRSQAVR